MAATGKPQKAFEEGRGYDKADWDDVSDNPVLTKETAAELKPFRAVFPDMAEAIEREIAKRGRPRVARPKKVVSLRLDPDVVDKFKASGKGWQTRINEILRDAKV